MLDFQDEILSLFLQGVVLIIMVLAGVVALIMVIAAPQLIAGVWDNEEHPTEEPMEVEVDRMIFHFFFG